MGEERQSPAVRTMRYLRYAIGEIVLVVAGILIALYINNWNEHRQQLALEIQYLLALKEEFTSNLESLGETKTRNERNLAAAIELAKHTGPDVPNISEKEFSRLFYSAVITEVQYRPGTGIINEIISSGNLSIISNKKLKEALASLDSLILKVRFQENEEVARERMGLFELANKTLSLRKMAADVWGDDRNYDRGKFLDGNLHLLQSREFDNRLVGFIDTSAFLGLNYYAPLEKQLSEIVRIIDEQLDSDSKR
ncbi:MAG: DUF6090 family protein [Pseudomonadota bacterium]